MKKAHILAEHPTNPELRCEVFVTGNLVCQFMHGIKLCGNEAEVEQGAEPVPASHRGQDIYMGETIIGKAADPNKTLAEYFRDTLVDQAEEYGLELTVNEL